MHLSLKCIFNVYEEGTQENYSAIITYVTVAVYEATGWEYIIQDAKYLWYITVFNGIVYIYNSTTTKSTELHILWKNTTFRDQIIVQKNKWLILSCASCVVECHCLQTIL